MSEYEAGRETDVLVARRLFRTVVVRPEWYPVDVLCFYGDDSPLMKYSYDERSCNAMMHRNGVDASDGTAPPLPFYTEEIEAAWALVEEMARRNLHVQISQGDRVMVEVWPLDDLLNEEPDYLVLADTAPLAIVRAFLAATGAA